MACDERQTRIERINPILHEGGWTDALIHEERTPGGTNISDGNPRKMALPGAILRVAFDFEEEEAS